MSVFIYAILFFLLYNFIVRVAIPVYRTTRQVKRQFSAMKEQFQQPGQQQPYPNGNRTQANNKKTQPGKTGEYIDFEEVK